MLLVFGSVSLNDSNFSKFNESNFGESTLSSTKLYSENTCEESDFTDGNSYLEQKKNAEKTQNIFNFENDVNSLKNRTAGGITEIMYDTTDNDINMVTIVVNSILNSASRKEKERVANAFYIDIKKIAESDSLCMMPLFIQTSTGNVIAHTNSLLTKMKIDG